MKIISWKNLTRLFVGFVLVSLVCLLVTTVLIQRQTYLEIQSANAKDNSTQVSFRQEETSPHPRKNIKFLQNTQNIRSLENFQASVFATSDSGLLKFSNDGKLQKHFTVLDGLPESDLISLAKFQNKLFIGTRSKGLLTFDGSKFTNFTFPENKTQAITSLKAEPRELLIGTFNGGLLSFDGKKFTEIKANKDERIYKINNITRIGEQHFIGTFDNGLWLINGENERQHLTKAEGLLSNRIVGIAKIGEEIYVGTDLGISKTNIAELSNSSESGKKEFKIQKVLPSLSSLTSFDEKLLATKANGELFLFMANSKNAEHKVAWKNSGKLLETSLLKLEDEIFLASNKGIFQIAATNKFSVSLNKFNEISAENLPIHNTVSAIAFDKDENLWLGTFRNGIDVFNARGKKLRHIETTTIRNINFLKQSDKGIIAATSQGIFEIDQNYQIKTFENSENLPSKSVMHFSNGADNSKAFATSRGFLVEENGQKRGFSTVQGLPSNNIYTTLQTGKTTFVGTLGGLAKIENGKVVRVYKDSNSELETNWVTALAKSNGRIFIGTYGGGTFELLPSGDIRKFSQETGKFFVNPNAMFTYEKRLFIGTLKGVRILNLQTEKWSHMQDILPSETVLSVTGNSDKLYFGTTNGVAIIDKQFLKQ